VAVGRFTVDIAPHFSGAIDVIAVRQADGTLKSTQFHGELNCRPVK
jgi:phosphatidate phosphatase PAH1